MRACLQTFDFKRLFVEELGWNTYAARIAPAEVDGVRCTFAPIAQQGGMVVVTCTDAELDFIIHYDIKYRMGRDADAEENGDD